MKQLITCPKCAHSFPLGEALNHEIESGVRQKLAAEFKKKEIDLRSEIEKAAADKASRVSAELQLKLETQAKELREAREQERALIQSKVELQDKAEKAQLEAQRQVAEERDKIRKSAQEQVLQEHRLKDAEKEKQMADLRREIDDLKRKAELGSQQLQGDVQELELEKALREEFPIDEITAVKTGQRGADILQKVRSDSGQFCGSILWESKRQKNWSAGWIDKLLEDKQAAKADLAVIVTDALPEHVAHMGSMRGVLITTFPLAICLASTLRVNMALLGQTRLALSGQEDQKSKLFQYFLGPEFQQLMIHFATELQEMQSELAREKAAITRTWSKRERHIENVIGSTARLTGTLQGFVGSALPPIPQFELIEGDAA